MNYSTDKFCSPHRYLVPGETCLTTAGDVSDYFSNTPHNLTLLRMLPCTSEAFTNNVSMISSSYKSERMMKQPVPVATDSAKFVYEEGDGGGGRWPRQETLTLLEIRARLNTRFRQATQKAPLWDEISRIMAEEYGYNRSGKKCKEKLENLYKYYKKTKQGKVGKHDGRHYRFFKQLEALYGDQVNNDSSIATQTRRNCKFLISGENHSMHDVRTSEYNVFQSSSMYDSLESSLPISNDLDDSSTEDEIQDDKNPSPKSQRNREESVLKEMIELQIKRLVEMQETWLDKIAKRIEQLEEERLSREEEWRRQEAARFELDQQIWNTEQARIKARDKIFIQALERISMDREGVKFS